MGDCKVEKEESLRKKKSVVISVSFSLGHTKTQLLLHLPFHKCLSELQTIC